KPYFFSKTLPKPTSAYPRPDCGCKSIPFSNNLQILTGTFYQQEYFLAILFALLKRHECVLWQ
ncbi:MAG: hypothetical protein LBK65_04475, partial [Tannerellaceae bacterium]|nr:hypothetical protein [Tannerellaceae bacterium]